MMIEERGENGMTNDLMNDIVVTAENFSQNFRDRYVFDFTISSLEAVEELLEEMSCQGLDDEMVYNVASMAGCYVFETARRNYGGEYFWVQEKQQPVLVAGNPDFSVAIYAWEKVGGRLLNGIEDNIPFYIDGYRENIERGKQEKGLKVTIV